MDRTLREIGRFAAKHPGAVILGAGLLLMTSIVLWVYNRDMDMSDLKLVVPTPEVFEGDGAIWGNYESMEPWQKTLYDQLKQNIYAGLEGRKPSYENMVRIPAGDAKIGAESHPDGDEMHLPPQTWTIGEFYIDKTEVTNAQYLLCVDKQLCLPLGGAGHLPGSDLPEAPALLTFKQAQRYCLAQGKRLPTEIEWEKAARGTDGRLYPWGNEPPKSGIANICDSKCISTPAESDWEDPYPATAPVGSFPDASGPNGLADIVGNVKEWTDSVVELPKDHFVARGASWYSGKSELYTYYRQVWKPGIRLDDKGVRCAADPPPPETD